MSLPTLTSGLMTAQQFAEALPPHLAKNMNQQVADSLNAVLADRDMAEQYRDNLLGFTTVLKEGKFKLTSYVNAVKYITQQVAGKNNQDAYMATFPDKWNDWLARGVSSKDISSYVSVYNGSKLVNLIREQSMIPNYILNQDLRQKAINHLATVMMTASSEKVQVEAAIGLINATKMPDKLKIEAEVEVKSSSVMDQLNAASLALAERMQAAVASGMWSAQDLLDEKVIEGEVVK